MHSLSAFFLFCFYFRCIDFYSVQLYHVIVVIKNYFTCSYDEIVKQINLCERTYCICLVRKSVLLNHFA